MLDFVYSARRIQFYSTIRTPFFADTGTEYFRCKDLYQYTENMLYLPV